MTKLGKSISYLRTLPAGMLVSSWAQAKPSLPCQSSASYLGVTGFAGSTRHGSSIASRSNVEQNEYPVWKDPEFPDKHAEARDALFGELAQLKVREFESLIREACERPDSVSTVRETAEIGVGIGPLWRKFAAGGDTWQEHFA